MFATFRVLFLNYGGYFLLVKNLEKTCFFHMITTVIFVIFQTRLFPQNEQHEKSHFACNPTVSLPSGLYVTFVWYLPTSTFVI